jgi:hypothetical protein
VLLEVGSIVVGVLLALAVNQWNEDRKSEAAAREALHHVAGELAANRAIIARVHEVNAAMLAYLDTATADSDTSLSVTPGLQIRDDAWRALMATGMSAHVDYGLLLSLSEVYSYQQVYRNFALQTTQAFLTATLQTAASGGAVDESRMTRQMHPTVALLGSIEAHLLGAYEDALLAILAAGVDPRPRTD